MIRIYIALLLIMCGCSATNKLRRAEKLINKAEEQGAKWHVDTVTMLVPVYIQKVSVDSVFVSRPGDTVVIQNDRLKIKYVRTKADTVMISGECAADTVYKNVPVTVVKTIKAKQTIKWWWLLIAFGGGIVFWIGYRQVKDR